MFVRIALIASAVTPILHVIVLFLSGQNAVRDPINALSRGEWGGLQTVGLVSFGIAHIALAVGLRGLDSGRLWPFGRACLSASGATLFYIAYFFSSADPGLLSGPEANDPLWIVACLVGLAMGILQPGLSRLSARLGLFSAVCLGVWLWLVPLILMVTDAWIGAYERLVGTVYVIWMIGVSSELLEIRSANDAGE